MTEHGACCQQPSVPGRAGSRRLPPRLRFTAAAACLVVITIVLGCEQDLLPRSIGSGEIIVTDYPSTILSVGDRATFTLELNLPPGQYELYFGVDPAGIDSDAQSARGETTDAVQLVVADDGSITANGQALAGTKHTVSDRLVAEGRATIGIVRSWSVDVRVVDPYRLTEESYVEAVFPYRVQWTE